MSISRANAALVIGLLSASPAAAAQDIQAPAPAGQISPSLPAPTDSLIIPHDTPVHLMVLNEVTTKTHPAGHRFPLRVDQPVVTGQQVVIPVGAMAWGEVVSAQSSGNVGKPGSLSARLLYIDLAGRHIEISGDTIARGRGGGAETAIGVLAVGPLGLFAKGNNAKIKAGERITAFTVNDFPLARPQMNGAVLPATAP